MFLALCELIGDLYCGFPLPLQIEQVSSEKLPRCSVVGLRNTTSFPLPLQDGHSTWAMLWYSLHSDPRRYVRWIRPHNHCAAF